MVSRYTKRAVLTGSGLVMMSLAGCSIPEPQSRRLTAGFEGDVDAWSQQADVPEDPNNPGRRVEWSIARSTDRAKTGQASLRFALDGRQDDGTVWVYQPLSVQTGQAYHVTGQCSAWSASESFNTLAHLVMYIGETPPTSEASFPPPGQTSTGTEWPYGGLREPLNRTAGWQPYSFSWTSPPLQRNALYVALGVSVVWETEIQYYVDDVVVSLDPV